MKLIFALLIIFMLPLNIKAQESNSEILKEGYLAMCWSEHKANNVDGTFVLGFSFADLSDKDRSDALFEATRMMRTESLILIGQPWFPYGSVRPDLTQFIVQADFQNPKFKSRTQLKQAVAKDLIALASLSTLNGNISCLKKNSVKPSMSGSN